MKKKILNWSNFFLPPIAWAGLIFLLSSQSNLPGPQASALDFFFKKIAHMFVYAVLYFLLHRAVNQEKIPAKNWWLPFLLCLAYSASDEIHQSFTPNRHPSINDIGFDLLGGWLAFLRIYRYI